MEFSLLKAQSDSPSEIRPFSLDLLKKTHSTSIEGEYINFNGDLDDDENSSPDQSQQSHDHGEFRTISKHILEEHTLRVSEIYRQMVVHVQNCPMSFCNFVFLCPKLQQYTAKLLDMDLPQIGYFEISKSQKPQTFNTLCDRGRDLNIQMKEEFLDFLLL